MELELSRRTINCCENTLKARQRYEGTAESIVPDYLPDISRILTTRGTVTVREKDVSEGRATVSGTADLTAVYAPEGGEGVRSLSMAIPFSVTWDGKNVSPAAELVADARLVSCETHVINPRKVLGKADICVTFAFYTPGSLTLTENVAGARGVEKLVRTADIAPIAGVTEKTFPVSDELEAGGGKPVPEELLAAETRAEAQECRVQEGRCIVKGAVRTDVLYRAGDELVSAALEVPFTQFAELESGLELPTCRCVPVLTGCSVELLEGVSGAVFAVMAYVTVQVVTREQMQVTVLEDLYSTGEALDVTLTERALPREDRCLTARQAFRELVETPTPAVSVEQVQVQVREVSVTGAGAEAAVTADLCAQVIYTDEQGSLCCASRRFSAAVPLEVPDCGARSVTAEVEPGLYGLAAAGDVELRFDLSVEVCCPQEETVSMVESVAAAEGGGARTDAPSVVLRSAEGGRIWDLAKRYRSSVETIRGINALEGDDLPDDGRLLLIPKKRA